MNKRIRELAKQAGLSHMPSNYPDMADLYKGADFELEKFAELIVRECIQSIEQTIDSKCDTDSEKMGCEFAITDLKQHFGVK